MSKGDDLLDDLDDSEETDEPADDMPKTRKQLAEQAKAETARRQKVRWAIEDRKSLDADDPLM